MEINQPHSCISEDPTSYPDQPARLCIRARVPNYQRFRHVFPRPSYDIFGDVDAHILAETLPTNISIRSPFLSTSLCLLRRLETMTDPTSYDGSPTA
jgi:hypothetical protein